MAEDVAAGFHVDRLATAAANRKLAASFGVPLASLRTNETVVDRILGLSGNPGR